MSARTAPSSAGSGGGLLNSRNGFSSEALSTEVGPVPCDAPRDCAGPFEPRLELQGSRPLGGLREMIVGLYAGGMTIRAIENHLAQRSARTCRRKGIRKVTDAVLGFDQQ